jgi:surface antigen
VLGAIAVFKNVKGGGHVGFVAGVAPDGTLRILGGNQSDRVKYSNFNPNGSTLKIIAFRVPNISNRALIVAPVVGGQAGNESTR